MIDPSNMNFGHNGGAPSAGTVAMIQHFAGGGQPSLPPGGPIPSTGAGAYGADGQPTSMGGGQPYGNDAISPQLGSAVPSGMTRRPDGRIVPIVSGPPAAPAPHPNTGFPTNPAAGGDPYLNFAQTSMPHWATAQGMTPQAYAAYLRANPNSPGAIMALGGQSPQAPPPAAPSGGGPVGGIPPMATQPPMSSPPPRQPPGAPVFGPAYGGGYGQPDMQQPGPQGGGGYDQSGVNGQPGAGTSFDDPISQVLAAIPAMNLNAQQQISGAMGSAGFTGNRWSSSAMNQAGQIGSQNAMQQNAMLTSALGDYANKAQDRSLAAANGSTALGGLLDQMAQNRITTPFAVGQYEQGRQDNFSNQAFQDWQQNKLGWFPYLLQAATSQGAGSPGQVVPITSAGKPGAIDYAQGLGGLAGLLGSFFGGSSGGAATTGA